MVMLMLRCGLRVEEVSRLKLAALDLRRSQVFVHQGKGAKDRVVYLSDDAYEALVQYLRVRPASRVKEVFLVDKGRCRGKAISVRGIQKRLEHYARQARLKVSCHQLRHTMATQLLNADAALVTIQDLLGHTRIKTTQRYCRVSNLKVQRDYHQAMAVVLAEDWMSADHDKPSFTHRTRQGAPAPTSNLGPILAGAPCLHYLGKEGYHQKPLDTNEMMRDKSST